LQVSLTPALLSSTLLAYEVSEAAALTLALAFFLHRSQLVCDTQMDANAVDVVHGLLLQERQQRLFCW
jgi:hypothetical protein